jgi:uroporphyrinogen-III synthase
MLPVHAVGDATARLAHAAGFTVASVGQGGSGAMDLPSGQRLLHLTGRDHRAVPGTTAVAVYEARALDAPPGLDQLGHCVVAVHSPRAGARFADLVRDRGDIAIVAISTAAAQAVGTGWQTISAATEPNDEALLALAARLCEGRDA